MNFIATLPDSLTNLRFNASICCKNLYFYASYGYWQYRKMISDMTFLSSPVSVANSLLSKVICFSFMRGRSSRYPSKMKIPPPPPRLVYIGYSNERQTTSYSIVRLHTPNSFARFSLLSCFLMHKALSIACRLSRAVIVISPKIKSRFCKAKPSNFADPCNKVTNNLSSRHIDSFN